MGVSQFVVADLSAGIGKGRKQVEVLDPQCIEPLSEHQVGTREVDHGLLPGLSAALKNGVLQPRINLKLVGNDHHDEADAPLDDANIDRFVRVLGKFAEGTQFIVVTHNKRTMEAADCLHGITMEEPGVSKLVSVKLEDA